MNKRIEQNNELSLERRPIEYFKFTHSPMLNAIHLAQINMNEFLRNAMKLDLTDVFLQDLEFRVKTERNVDIVITGETGSGKSAMAKSIYWRLHQLGLKHLNKDLKFSADNITVKSWNRKLKTT